MRILHSQSETLVLWVLIELLVHTVSRFFKFYLVVKSFTKENLTVEDSISRSAPSALYALTLELQTSRWGPVLSLCVHSHGEVGGLMTSSSVYDM